MWVSRGTCFPTIDREGLQFYLFEVSKRDLIMFPKNERPNNYKATIMYFNKIYYPHSTLHVFFKNNFVLFYMSFLKYNVRLIIVLSIIHLTICYKERNARNYLLVSLIFVNNLNDKYCETEEISLVSNISEKNYLTDFRKISWLRIISLNKLKLVKIYYYILGSSLANSPYLHILMSKQHNFFSTQQRLIKLAS